MMSWIPPCLLLLLVLASPAVAKTSVVLITVEALRADHLEPYGYEKVKTPAISTLAREGVTFEKAVVQTPLGLPSHASILTGTYPQHHGLQNEIDNLRTGVPTLAEWFRERDYATGAFVGCAILLAQWGLNRGFQTYDDHFSMSTDRPTEFDSVQRPAQVVVERAASWLDEHGDKPFFLWLNLSDPREPYTPPAPFSEEYTSVPYDGEIAYVDSMLSRFFDVLRDRKLYEESLILLSAPHGTALGEHGEKSHGFFLYHSSLHVPLIMKLPEGKLPESNSRGAGSGSLVDIRVSEQVRSVDLAPTIVQIVGGHIPESMQGKSLRGFLTGQGPAADLPAYSETYYPSIRFGWSPLFSYCSGDYKFIRAPYPELYDLASDPSELRNIYDEKKDLAVQMNTELEQLLTQFTSKYSQNESGNCAVDPKTKMEVYRKIDEAASESRSGRSEKAIATIREVLQKEPENPAARFVLGSEYLEQGQYLLAVQEFRAGLKKTPTSYEQRITLSLAYLRAGLNRQAQEILGAVLEKNPADSVAQQFLAISYAKQGNLDEAVVHGRIAVELRPLSASAHYNLASYLLGSGQDAEALEGFKKTVEIAPAHIEGRSNLSFVLLRLGRYDEALQQAKEVVRLAPQYSLGHFYLGQAYRLAGMGQEAEASFRRAKELDPQLQIPVLNR